MRTLSDISGAVSAIPLDLEHITTALLKATSGIDSQLSEIRSRLDTMSKAMEGDEMTYGRPK
jgi:hypothetical protein